MKKGLYRIIFESDTKTGRSFDMVLIITIVASVVAVMLDSIKAVNARHANIFYAIEWFFTIAFTVEYILRLYCVDRRLKYASSFFGIVDLVAVLPTYLSIILPGSQYLIVIRILRVLRIFRVLKLMQYVREAGMLVQSLRASIRKIVVFLFTVVTLVIVFGSLMYLIEGEANGFTSIPRSIYWAVVTLTTVGYGDISPKTGLGQFVASIIMIMGYSIIAVPTGIVTVEMSNVYGRQRGANACPACLSRGHDPDAKYCKNCGARL